MDNNQTQGMQEENNHLQFTRDVIQLKLNDLQFDPSVFPLLPIETLNELFRLYIKDRENWQKALLEPYFGRVDFRTVENQQLYIGKVGIRKQNTHEIVVYDWRAPISSIFYLQGLMKVTYNTPNGSVQGDVILRRHFKFVDGELINFTDERPQLPSNPTYVDQYLLDVLRNTHDNSIRDIIATIQSEQYTLITAPLESIMIIQGVAGSGKTAIMLHRLAYLLYQYPNKLNALNTLVLVPNPLLLSNIAKLFPQLSMHNVQQFTFTQWIQHIIGDKLPQINPDESIEDFLNPGRDHQKSVIQYRRYRLLGSLQMVKLLQSYMVSLKTDPLLNARGIQIVYKLPKQSKSQLLFYDRPEDVVHLEISRDVIIEILKSTNRGKMLRGVLPDAIHRDKFCHFCVENFWKQFRRTLEYGSSLDDSNENARKNHFEEEIKKDIKHQILQWWPIISPAELLMSLLGNRTKLDTINFVSNPSPLTFTKDELDIIHIPNIKNYIWTECDLSLLCFAKLFLEGMPSNFEKQTLINKDKKSSEFYDYIVLDEAQDRSPLDLILLELFAKDMTIVGDLTQGVFAHQGLKKWSQVNDALNGSISYFELQSSYRSTFEIMQFANRILANGKFSQGILPAKPLARHGLIPRELQCNDNEHMLKDIMDIVRNAYKVGKRNIAIITKTMVICKNISRYFLEHDESLITPIHTTDRSLVNGAVCLPVWLAKGLEFDIVITVGVDEKTYAISSEVDAKLLYVAVTRALHELTIVYVGKPSLLLQKSRTTSRPVITSR